MEATINNESTTTVTPPKNAQPKSLGLKLILLPNILPRFCCCQRENMLSSREGFITYPMYHHGQTIKYINIISGNKENGSISLTVRAKEKSQLSHSGPS